jgi:hypothetical protein
MAKYKFNPLTGNFDLVGDATSEGGGAFDGNRPITLQGIPGLTGKTLGGSTIKDFLEGYFPAVPPGASLTIAANATRLFGSSNAVTLNYTATKNTNPITAIVVNGQNIVPTGDTQSGSQVTSAAQNQDTTFNMSVSAGANTTTASASVLWRHYRFWFKTNQDLLSMTDDQISAILNGLVSGFEFATSRDQQSRTFAPQGEYVYFAYLATNGNASFIVNGLSNNAFLEKDFQYANPYAYTTAFKLYRTSNLLTGNYNIDIN